ncbi:MAG: polymer-forming cytoskeletal protein [Alphaproteobacteria bacterium]|nr:polymer-forming cytoskeletal protein [Alphaproteobacteria bacterium]
MFSKIKQSKDVLIVNNDKRPRTPSVISSDLTVTGDIVSEGEVHIDGTVEGDVRCRTLIIGMNAHVHGSIEVDVAKVHGCIDGILCARNVFLASSAKVVGDITHEKLEIEQGAYLEGHCRHTDDPIPAEQAPSDLMITDERKKTNKTVEANKK